MMVHSTEREHDKTGGSEERVMGWPKDRRTSAHLGNDNNTQEEPAEGERGGVRDAETIELTEGHTRHARRKIRRTTEVTGGPIKGHTWHGGQSRSDRVDNGVQED